MSNLLARLTSWNQCLRVAGINTGSAVLDHVKSHMPAFDEEEHPPGRRSFPPTGAGVSRTASHGPLQLELQGVHALLPSGTAAVRGSLPVPVGYAPDPSALSEHPYDSADGRRTPPASRSRVVCGRDTSRLPAGSIRFVTNGVLLPQAPRRFGMPVETPRRPST